MKDVVYSAFDNSTVLTCESLFVLLEREGCDVYKSFGSKGFAYPSFVELEQDIEKIQAIKKVFIWRFWKVSRWEAMRAISTARLAMVCILF